MALKVGQKATSANYKNILDEDKPMQGPPRYLKDITKTKNSPKAW